MHGRGIFTPNVHQAQRKVAEIPHGAASRCHLDSGVPAILTDPVDRLRRSQGQLKGFVEFLPQDAYL
jgi:hypothetical protein